MLTHKGQEVITINKGRFARLLILFSTAGLLLLVFCGNLVVYANGEDNGREEIPVGDDVYAVSMLDILAPWLGLVAFMAVAMAVLVIMKRRRLA